MLQVGSASAFYPINATAVGSSVNYGLDQGATGGIKDLGAAFSINNGNTDDWHSQFPYSRCQVATGGGYVFPDYIQYLNSGH